MTNFVITNLAIIFNLLLIIAFYFVSGKFYQFINTKNSKNICGKYHFSIAAGNKI